MRIPIAIILSIALHPTLVRAVDQRLGPDAAVALALASNRYLQAAELEVRRARARLFWEGRLDNPELELAAATDSFGRAEGEATFAVAFVQRFPLSSKLRDAVELRRVGVALAEAEVNEHRRKLAAEVRATCVELAAGAREVELYQKLVALNAEIVEFLEGAADRGEASRLDLVGAQLSGKGLEREAAAAVAARDRKRSELRPLLGMGAEDGLEIAFDLPLPARAPAAIMARKEVLARRPDYQTALIRGNVARAELALAKAEGLEDLALKLFAERERATDAPGGLEGNTMIGVGITIPLPIRKRNEAAIESAKVDIDQSKLAAEALALNIENQLSGALGARMAAYVAARDASGETLQLADANLRDFREAYAAGQASFVQVQRAQEQKLELEKAALAALKEYHLADAEVRRAAATEVITKAKGSK